MTAADRYTEWDAAYVLGALSPEERREFEEHLAGCASCQQAVSEIAGLPGLLGQVAPEDAAAWSAEGAAPGPDAVPETLLPRLMADLRQRRRRVLTVVGAVAAALALLAGGIAIGLHLTAIGNDPQRVAFTPVAASSLTALVDLVPVSDGTSVRVECQYGEVDEVNHGDAYDKYSIVVVDRAGVGMDVKEWSAKPNKVMRPQAVTPLRISQIKQVEIRRTATGEILLSATPR